MKKFTTQEVIDMGAQLYDNRAVTGFTRADIRKWLEGLLACECANFDFDAIFDLICG